MVVSIQSLAQQIVGRFDRNYDGAIDLKRNADYEAERLQYYYQSTYTDDMLTLSWISQENLFQKADRNGDKKATLQEIQAVLSQFDRNGDGYLESNGNGDLYGEYASFNQAYPENWGVISQQRIPRATRSAPIQYQQPLLAFNFGAVGVWANRN